MRAPIRAPRKNKFLPLLLVALLGMVGLVAGYFLFVPPAPPPAPPTPPPVMREVQLYFATADGAGLDTETRQIEDCQIEEDCLRRTLQALIAGPSGPLVAVLPPRTEVQTVSVEESTAWISFSRELIAGHPGGSMTELLTVHALANTLAVNFAHIRQVRILVEGEPVETLKGHVDLRGSIATDFSLSRPRINPDAAPSEEE